MRKIATLSLAVLLAAASHVSAQEAKKPLSPPAKAEATLAGKSITIQYSAPSRRDRTIMGALVPYGKIWRTGANAATSLTTTGDLMIGNVHVPAGAYTLFTIPGEKEWTLIVSKQTGLWGTGGYDEKQDLGRVTVPAQRIPNMVETFAIALTPSGAKTANLTLTWENTNVTVPLTVH